MHASRWLRSLQHVAVLFMLLACKPACCAARSTTRLHWRLTTACLEDAPVRQMLWALPLHFHVRPGLATKLYPTTAAPAPPLSMHRTRDR